MKIATGKRPIRVLAWPRQSPASIYFEVIYDRLAAERFEVDDFSPRKLADGAYDIFHLHFPDSVFYFRDLAKSAVRALWVASTIVWMKLRGARIVWTVHNLRSHERPHHPRLERWYYALYTRLVDCYICMNRCTRDPLLERYPALAGKPCHIVPHPHYRGAYPNSVTKADARADLGLEPDARVVLFIGQLRPYKNVPALIRAFRRLPDEKLRLVIAGLPANPDVRTDVETLAREDPRIRLHLDFVPDDRVQHFLNAADLVALPYRDILNSGVAILALSFDRPVFVPRRGAMGELAGIAGDDWVRLFDDELTPEDLASAVDWATAAAGRRLSDLKALDPGTIARDHEAIYQDLAFDR